MEKSKAYMETEKLLRRLAVLMDDGKSESLEVDTVRDEMEIWWYKLTPEEEKSIRQLSVDLYNESENKDGQANKD